MPVGLMGVVCISSTFVATIDASSNVPGTCFTWAWYGIRPPRSAPLERYAGPFSLLICLFVLSMSRHFEVCSDGTSTFHPSPLSLCCRKHCSLPWLPWLVPALGSDPHLFTQAE